MAGCLILFQQGDQIRRFRATWAIFRFVWALLHLKHLVTLKVVLPENIPFLKALVLKDILYIEVYKS